MPICPTCCEHYLGDESFCPRDGTPLQAPQADPVVGHLLGGRYLVETRIGEGGMGTVYRARQQSLDRAVAVKLLRRDLIGDDAAVVRFQREARAASALDHPNCIKVLDFGQTEDGLLYLVMELLAGESLGQVLLRGPLPVLRALALMRCVAHALGHAHDHSIIHRDLKPDNVYLCPGDVVKVLDFGLCKRVSDVEAGVTQAGVVFGTPEYMSPEQAEAKRLDARSDLYSLGAVLFRAVTGDLPFHASTYVGLLTQHVSALPPVPSAVRPEQGIPPAVDELVLRLLEKDPADRPPTAQAVVDEIDRVIALLEMARTGEAAGAAARGGGGPGAAVPQVIPAYASGPAAAAYGSGSTGAAAYASSPTGAAAYGSGPTGAAAYASGPAGAAAAVPTPVAAVRSGPLGGAPTSGRVETEASAPYAEAAAVDSSSSMSTPAVPRTSRAPLLAVLLLLVLAGAGLGAWRAGWLRDGSIPLATAVPRDAGPPASAPAPSGPTAATGMSAVAAPALNGVPSPTPPTEAKGPATPVRAAVSSPAGHRRPPREVKLARAPQRDAGLRLPPPLKVPPPPVKVLPPPPQQDAGVPAARAGIAERVTLHLVKARVAIIRGDLEGAVRELEAARGLRENAAVHVGFAEVYTRQGNTLRALAHWQKAVHLSPRDPTLRVRFAEALARAGEVEEACAAVRAALGLKPQHGRALALQARLGCTIR